MDQIWSSSSSRYFSSRTSRCSSRATTQNTRSQRRTRWRIKWSLVKSTFSSLKRNRSRKSAGRRRDPHRQTLHGSMPERTAQRISVQISITLQVVSSDPNSARWHRMSTCWRLAISRIWLTMGTPITRRITWLRLLKMQHSESLCRWCRIKWQWALMWVTPFATSYRIDPSRSTSTARSWLSSSWALWWLT